MDTVSVEWYEVPTHATEIWSGRREEIAKAFLALAAVDKENMATLRDIKELVGGDTNNLRKTLETMPGVVKVLATPYKSRLPTNWFYDQRVSHLAEINHPGHIYPLTIAKADLSRLATVQIKLRPIDNEDETKRIYYQHHGRQNSGKTNRVENAPGMPKWVQGVLANNPDWTIGILPITPIEREIKLTRDNVLAEFNRHDKTANGIIAVASMLVKYMNDMEKNK